MGQTNLVGKPLDIIDPPFAEIAEDVTQTLIQFLAEKGHGKTSSLATIVKHCKENNANLVFKIFDLSQAWFHNAPVQYRQMVTPESWRNGQVENLGDCVYEMGMLSEESQRIFVASIINEDYNKRYNEKHRNAGSLKHLPWIIYIFEEADIYFGSRSFMKNDNISPILKKYVSVGRNFQLSGFLVATAEQGEVATKLRRRARHIYGKIEASGDLAKIKRRDKASWEIVKNMPKYHFIYFSGTGSKPFRIRDEVKQTPEDYFVPLVETEKTEKTYKYQRPLGLSWWEQAFIGLVCALIINWFFWSVRG